jgi:hypothetical protein
MFRIHVFHSTYDGKPVAAINEVETLDWKGETMYRDVNTGRVDRSYSGVSEQFFETREEATAAAVAGLQRLADEFAALCRQEIAKVQS